MGELLAPVQTSSRQEQHISPIYLRLEHLLLGRTEKTILLSDTAVVAEGPHGEEGLVECGKDSIKIGLQQIRLKIGLKQ